MRTRAIILAALCPVLLAAGCGMVDNMTGVSQAKELQASGRSAKGVILGISDTGMTVNDDPVAWLDLEVRPENESAFQARTKCLIPRLDVPQFQPGCTVPVRYDPADHTRVAVDVYRYR
jgi:hypothetical protein